MALAQITVIMPVLNRADKIGAAMASMVEQTLPDWCLIVVDDHSEDNTVAVVEEWRQRDSRISLLKHPVTLGAQAARNTGIRAATTDWIAFLDSDDKYYPTSCADRLACARQQQVDVVHSEGDVWHPHNHAPIPMRLPPFAGNCYRNLLQQFGPMYQSLLVRREALLRIGLLDETIISHQEWDTAIRLARFYPFGYLPQATYLYDLRRAQGYFDQRSRYAKGYEQIIRKHRWAILRHCGPATLSSHYWELMKVYYRADLEKDAHRCRRLAELWAPLDALRRRLLMKRKATQEKVVPP